MNNLKIDLTTLNPNPIIQKYQENPERTGTFDLVSHTEQLNIKFLVLTIPKMERFKVQGAKIICESWHNGMKTLFTGLRLLKGTSNVFYGNQYRPGKKKSFLCLIQEGNTYQMHYFQDFCPRTNRAQIAFLMQYFQDQINNT